MPPVIAAVVVEVVAYELGYVALTTLVVSLIALAASVVLGGLAQLLASKPKTAGNPIEDRSAMVKQPISYHRIILGQIKISGIITFMASYQSTTPGTGQTSATISFALVGSSPGAQQYTVTSLGSNNYQYTFNATNANNPIIINYRTNLGVESQAFIIPGTPYQIVLNATAGYQDLGVTTTNPGASNVAPNGRLEMVLTVSGHPISSFGSFYLDDELVQFDGSGNAIGRWAGYAFIVAGLGTPTTDAAFMARGMQQAPDLWTSNHKQTGCAKLWITFLWNRNLFSGSIPNVSAIVNGALPYDPRTSTSQWTSNAVLCIRYYLIQSGIVKADLSNIDDTVTIAGANTCDELITLAAGGTENRYMCNGVVDTSQTPQSILPNLLSACAGKLVYCGGKWAILVGAYRTPTIALSEDDLDGNVKTQTRVSFRDGFNGVKGTYYSPGHNWQAWDFQPVVNATYLAEDGGITSWADITLPFTISDSASQRIGKVLLEEVRQGITTYWPCKLTALQCQAGDVIMLNRTRLGWVNKPFEVISFSFSVRGSASSGDMRLGVDLVLRETASGVYDWNSGLETTTDLAPDTILPNVYNVLPPGIPVVSESTYLVTDSSGLKVDVTLTCIPSTDPYAQTYQFEYMAVADTSWTVLPSIRSPQCIIYAVPAGQYYFRVKVINYIGISSTYTTTPLTEIYALTVSPPDITNLSLQVVSSLAVLYWTQSPDLGVQNGGSIIIRFTQADISTATWEQGVEIVQAVAGVSNHAVVPLKAGTYMVKALNSGGKESNNPAMAKADAASLFTYTGISTITEDPTFTGTKTNTQVVSSLLKLTQPSGLVSASGSYVFANIMNFGAVSRVRLTTNLVSLTYNIGDTIDVRAGNVDSWLDWDGSGGGSHCNIIIQVATTQTNPGGSPVWSAWNNLVNADYSCWGAKFQALLTSDDTTFNTEITNLGIIATNVTGLS